MKYANGSCELILDIFVPRTFQWYKELFNPMNFSPLNHLLKIWKSIKTPTPKVGDHLGVCEFIPSHSSTFPGTWNVTLGLHSWPAPLQTLLWFAIPRLGLQQKLDILNVQHSIFEKTNNVVIIFIYYHQYHILISTCIMPNSIPIIKTICIYVPKLVCNRVFNLVINNSIYYIIMELHD